jgi:phage tail-like protein
MTTSNTAAQSGLLEYLPAIYRDYLRDYPLIGQFLSAFEQVLVGDNAPPSGYKSLKEVIADGSLEEIIANLATLFDPLQTPDDFLPWLADWTAFSLRADLDPTQQRQFIAQIIQLYRWRGTKQNLQELLRIFTTGTPEVIEAGGEDFQIGVKGQSTLGVDTWLGGSPPHYFEVTVSFPQADSKTTQRRLAITHDLIEMEKPAHTFYDLRPIFPSMQIGVKGQSTLGVDTLLGTIPQ